MATSSTPWPPAISTVSMLRGDDGSASANRARPADVVIGPARGATTCGSYGGSVAFANPFGGKDLKRPGHVQQLHAREDEDFDPARVGRTVYGISPKPAVARSGCPAGETHGQNY
jgi:hypothetical protein